MRSAVLIFGDIGKKETELNERIAEKEKEGWEVVDMQIAPPSSGWTLRIRVPNPVIIVRLARESN